jgi:hypothetical protein
MFDGVPKFPHVFEITLTWQRLRPALRKTALAPDVWVLLLAFKAPPVFAKCPGKGRSRGFNGLTEGRRPSVIKRQSREKIIVFRYDRLNLSEGFNGEGL